MLNLKAITNQLPSTTNIVISEYRAYKVFLENNRFGKSSNQETASFFFFSSQYGKHKVRQTKKIFYWNNFRIQRLSAKKRSAKAILHENAQINVKYVLKKCLICITKL